MENRYTRRSFLVTAGAASATVLGASLFNVETVLAGPPVVRRDIGGLTAADPIIASYRKAIKAMRALPSSNPVSWAYQAAIHGTHLSPPPPGAPWNTCEHGTDFFWSWHRMYLYWFERIIRKMSGDPNWALPYWNWTSATERQLPPMFRDPTSDLYTPNRAPAMNSGAGSLPAGHVSYSSSFVFTNFFSANSTIQGTPHGAIHVDVGGPTGWMSDINAAGQDPIFYLHHSNIDRLWDLWLAQGGGRTDPLGNAAWKSKVSTFVDESGSFVKMTACDVLRAAQQLNYKYEGEPPQVNEYCLVRIPIPILIEVEVLIHLPWPPVELGPQVVSMPVDISQLRERLLPLAQSKTDTVLLVLDDIVAEHQPGVVWEVYLGLPANAAPNSESPQFVGNIALFGQGIRDQVHGGEFKPARFAFAINRALLAALQGKEQKLQVTFVPSGVLIDGKPAPPKVAAPVKIGRADIAVQREKQAPQRAGEVPENPKM
jgi:tyrosinase